MADFSDTGSEIRETDLVFDCPYCGKSLAIDYHGAGLNIQCTDCGRDVQVPIPEDMEIFDLDSSAEDQEVRILNLRHSLAVAEERVNRLETQLAFMREQLVGRAGGDSGANGVRDVLAKAQLVHEIQAEIIAALTGLAAEQSES